MSFAAYPWISHYFMNSYLAQTFPSSIDAKSEGISFVTGMTAMSKEYMMRAPFRPWRRCHKCTLHA